MKACSYMLPRPRRSMFQPNTHKVHVTDSAATQRRHCRVVGATARSNSPPAHSGLVTATLLSMFSVDVFVAFSSSSVDGLGIGRTTSLLPSGLYTMYTAAVTRKPIAKVGARLAAEDQEESAIGVLHQARGVEEEDHHTHVDPSRHRRPPTFL